MHSGGCTARWAYTIYFFKEEQSLGNSIQTAVYTESRFEKFYWIYAISFVFVFFLKWKNDPAIRTFYLILVMHQYKLWWDPLYSYWLKIYNQSNQFCFSFFVPIDFALSLYEGLKEAFHVKKKEQKQSLLAFINVLNYLMFQYNPFLRRHLERNVQSCSTQQLPSTFAFS